MVGREGWLVSLPIHRFLFLSKWEDVFLNFTQKNLNFTLKILSHLVLDHFLSSLT